jgi:hypothetical protein
MLLLVAWPGPAYGQEAGAREEAGGPPPLMAQTKPRERGNCFQWPGCRGDSIGAMWVTDPDICKSLGGKSWMAPDRKCYNLPGGPHNIQGP